MPTRGRVTAARGRRQREGDLTPAWLQENGWIHKSCEISGCDMWQGMDFWTYESTYGDMIHLRGNISTSFGGWLTLMEFSGAMLSTQESITTLIKLLTHEGSRPVDRSRKESVRQSSIRSNTEGLPESR